MAKYNKRCNYSSDSNSDSDSDSDYQEEQCLYKTYDDAYVDSNLQFESKLVLLIEKKDTFLEIKMFVCWSENDQCYYVRCNNEENNVPFGFRIDSITNVYEFIKSYFNKNTIKISVYNYNNIMYWNIDDLTYEFFETYRDDQYLMNNMTTTGIIGLPSLLEMIRFCYNKHY